MAVVEFSRKDFEKLVGRKLSDSDLTEKITMMGFPLEKIEGDRIFYEVFPNRPDMLCVEGFARSVRHFLSIDRKVRIYSMKPSGVSVKVDPSVKEVRPFLAAAVIEKVRFTDDFISSLMQIQEKLHDTLGRKRKKVAIGVHDFEKVKPPFIYMAACPKEISFVPLGMTRRITMEEVLKEHEKGRKYSCILQGFGKYPVITDRNGEVLSFPPIINSDITRVTENTTKLFIDVTGTSEQAVMHALNVLVTALVERGCVAKTVEVSGIGRTPDLSPRKMKIDPSYVSRMLGVKLTEKEISGLLARMGMGYSKGAVIPAYRTDIMHPIDVAEDIAIAYGYQNFEPKIPGIFTIAKRIERDVFLDAAKDVLTGMGCQETIGMILTNETDEFSKMRQEETYHCITANPTTVECTMARISLIPSLLRALSQNKNREYPQKIFEAGPVIMPDRNSETGASESFRISFSFSDAGAAYEDASKVLESLLSGLGIKYSLKRKETPIFASGRCAEIIVSGKSAGIVGEIHPAVLENWKIEKPVSAFELDVSAIAPKS